MVDILAPFQQATDFAQKQNSVSGSGVIPCVVGLECQLKSLSSKYNTKMLKTLRSSVEKRLKPYLEKNCYRLATMLDPRFKLLWCTTTSEKSDAIEELTKLGSKLGFYVPFNSQGHIGTGLQNCHLWDSNPQR